jgi:hypothetical protein
MSGRNFTLNIREPGPDARILKVDVDLLRRNGERLQLTREVAFLAGHHGEHELRDDDTIDLENCNCRHLEVADDTSQSTDTNEQEQS